MCGIVAVIASDNSLDPELAAALGPMTDCLSHRGPDSGQTKVLPRAALGHRRLSIIDVASGAQPMANEDASVWVVFNGEIYNHHELRHQLLAKGHSFRTHSDTEVIVHGYEEWGASCVERFDGMFAFVVHDNRRGATLAARDRLGKKPLFYTLLRGHLHLASELKALKASPYWDSPVDHSFLETFLMLGYVVAPQTAYRGVYKLLPGHVLEFSDGVLNTRRYWDVREFGTDSRDEPAVLAELDERLGAAVGRRLESEVPLGAFLSGGIDSSLVVAYMAQNASAPPLTVSVGFTNDPHSELATANATAAALGTHHLPMSVNVTPDTLIPRVGAAFDEPFADSSAIPTYYVCEAARRNVTVALSGDGGDETFAGYDFRYLPHMRDARLRSVGLGMGRPVSALLARLWPRWLNTEWSFRAMNLLANVGGSEAEGYYRDLCFLKPERVRDFLPTVTVDYRASAAYATIRDAYARCPSPDPLQRALYADIHTYLPNDPLVKVDRMSMLHGLEVRCPLLDHALAEFAFRLPSPFKLTDTQGKRVLRQLARKKLPPHVVDLPKRGFEAPVAHWFRGPLGLRYRDEVLEGKGFVAEVLDVTNLRRAFESHRQGRGEHGYLLWATWMLEAWAASDRR